VPRGPLITVEPAGPMNRRTFLKIAGMSGASFATGCNPEPEKRLYSLVHAPQDMVTGEPGLYASTCRECPAGCGVLAIQQEARIIKLEGNPAHPINRGKLCPRGQAALQAVYNPDRLKQPRLRTDMGWKPLSFMEAESLLKRKAEEASVKGENRVRMVSEVVGAGLAGLFSEWLAHWKSDGPLLFEPFGYEALRTANKMVLGVDGLVSYEIQEADVLVSFGADFLETWLSPVEYAWKFKKMHGLKEGSKGFFFHVGSYLSLTGANADHWISCAPGGEAAIALALIKEALLQGRGAGLDPSFKARLAQVVESFSRDRAINESGVLAAHLDMLCERLLKAKSPLILGTGSGCVGWNPLQANVAVNLLNLILDPGLTRLSLTKRHRVEAVAKRSEVEDFFAALAEGSADLLILHNTNPAYTLPHGSLAHLALRRDTLFKVSFSNFMDETSDLADLVFPVRLPLEWWGEYEGKKGFVSALQPAMGRLTEADHVGDVLIRNGLEGWGDYKSYLFAWFKARGLVSDERDWVAAMQSGGIMNAESMAETMITPSMETLDALKALALPRKNEMVFIASPSIRFFDGRGANRPWLPELPDTITKVAWQTPILMHPETLANQGLKHAELIRIECQQGVVEAPAYETGGVRPNVMVMAFGQGHTSYGRYAKGKGANPVRILSAETDSASGGPVFSAFPVSAVSSHQTVSLAHKDGSRYQHGRKIAMTVSFKDSGLPAKEIKTGLTMYDFPLTLPLPEGCSSSRELCPPHEHKDYRWSMVVDLDRCIGCGACTVACYAENNVGVVGEAQIVKGREMAWLKIERYFDESRGEKVIFLPFPCQHCDDAPCESVCPVFAPHHDKEGLNVQIYNRCIGTRFCAQSCPYKIRRFNWSDWQWPKPLDLQLNPRVTVRSQGVMEKCSFCVQRIKAAHDRAKNENRMIRDGEVVPACAQTCPTSAITFGNLMDPKSGVRQMVQDPRAYQVMGYLNTKPAVIYLKKVVHDL
jgi:Fe-S-cluster-containing dehydrogenase component/anaerobic selenocysteine-containing dehydrogenase